MKSIASGLSRRIFLQAGASAGLAGGLGLAPAVSAADKIKPTAKSALIVVDVQNCFVDGGTLPVKGGAEIVPVINNLATVFENVVVTQDWHTPEHASFASAHSGKRPFDTTQLPYGAQVLWPDHCVQGTDDAALVNGLKLPHAALIIRKGFHKNVDSYSAFEGGGPQDLDGPRRLSQGPRHRHRVHLRARDRLLCRLDGPGRAQGRLCGLCRRGRRARHRPQRVAGGSLEADDGGRREAHQVVRRLRHLTV